MSSLVWVNGVPSNQISALDRGLCYGDGLYRTLKMVDGQPCLWYWHYKRLAEDAQRLRLPLPDETLLLAELGQVGQGIPQAVVKIILTRGVGERGYAIPVVARPSRILSASAWAGYPTTWYTQGIRVFWCQTRLAIQPQLAGIKHLNRLENVIARSEWSNAEIAEGILQDTEGWVVGGTMSNLYCIDKHQIKTPLLDRCGVKGALRDWLLTYCIQSGVPIIETRLCPEVLWQADAVFLSNSLLGVCPVQLNVQACSIDHPLIDKLQQALQAEIKLGMTL